MRKPTKDELKKINRFKPSNAPELTADDIVIVSFRVADNMVNRGSSRWDCDSLKKLAELLPGKPLLADHNHEQISSAIGCFFDASFESADEIDDSVLAMAGNGDLNKPIFDSEGYCSVIGDAFVSSDSPILKQLALGSVGSVSLGAFRYSAFICPECGFSLTNPKCPHVLDGMYADDSTPVVKYFIRADVFDLGECSICNVPNLPNARVI